ncbi:hypothetical protein CWI80_12185 [Pseudidiomarina sediminum]|uniref:diguanylate cyclase n=1 Tax=Pseudidiomarina sediminum TaxID=431675 RepID=A0A432YZE7_9GAMM|nr:diguanylate cyclase [Pseudidiomarina sediminum]RUO68981.1 hypothetical protein CWI80_12185 [Pseudidiomarina sediminum]
MRDTTTITNTKGSALLSGLGYGAIAAIVNYFLAFEIYGSLTVIFGQVFVLLALFTRGLLAAMVSALLAALAISIYTDNVFFFVTLLSEVAVVHYLYQRRIPILVADLIYWCVFGMPFSYLYVPTVIDVPQSFLFLILAKLLMNGLLYTALAILLYQLLPRRWKLTTMTPVSDTLRGRIFYLSFLCIIISSLCFSFLFTVRSTQQAEQQIVSDIGSKANSLRQVTEDFVDDYVVAVRNLRDSMERVSDYEEKLMLMDYTQRNFPGFVTMLWSDAQGTILHGVPVASFSAAFNRMQESPSISDRDYFLMPKASGQGYVSSAFRGRAIGEQPIIAISAPYHRNNRFAGIIEGSLDIPELVRLVQRTDIDPRFQSVIVTDNEHQVIFATEDTALAPLSYYEPTYARNPYSLILPLTRIQQRDVLYTQRMNDYGWNIYVFSSPQEMTDLFLGNILILALFLSIITALFAVVTRRFAHELNRPLEQLVAQLGDPTNVPDLPSRADVTREVRALTDNLIAARKVMVDFNHQLQQQVEEQTADLARLNERLNKLAREDDLTGLLNRRTFDELAEQGYHEAMATRGHIALILADIDHFKRINDTMGHPVGDACLRCVGQLIQQHFASKGCLCARYGGEEFAMFVTDIDDVHAMVTDFQQALSQSCEVQGQVVPMSISMGVVEIKQHFSGESFRRLVAHADKLLYESKDAGRNRITIEQL